MLTGTRRYLNILLLGLVSGAASAQQPIDPGVFAALNSANQAQQAEDYQRARTSLEAALETSREGSIERALVEQRLGYLAIARDRNDEAIRWLTSALTHGQLERDAARQDRLNLAQLNAIEGHYQEAASLLEQERAQAPLDMAFKRLLVQSYNRLEQYEKAVPLAEQVVNETARADSVWYQLLVGMNYQLERFAQAERWLKVLLKREPGNAEHWRQLAGIQSADGRQKAAAGTLRLAHEAGIDFSAADLERMVALQLQAGAPWQAARLLEALLQQQLLSASNTRNEYLAQLWQQARDHTRAQAAWTALAAQSGEAEHWLRLAGIQLEQGQWTDLLSTLAQAEAAASTQQQRQIAQWRAYANNALESMDDQ
ncbi:MAG TPA: hypothetical protein ENI17_14845 [Pseudomonas xinjiangensis]|uniref:Tetratricopeptide repeat-containing protein n=2 Tax=root TaxID=1 RepID=A0A7V1BS85_9GAMM|nr:hypothetical protein [Halopseudomonas xinjiangensis]HEC48886.1 hypothetical protein [Halopseudomonas xinjiangensis]